MPIRPASTRSRIFCLNLFLCLFTLLALYIPTASHAGPEGKTPGLSSEQIAQNKAIANKLLKSLQPGQQEVNLGCMRLHVEYLRALASEGKSGFLMELMGFEIRWPDGIVHYAFNPPGIEDGTIDAKGRVAMGRKEVVREAMDDWAAAAKLTFIEIPLGDPDGVGNYIIINDNADGNNSLLGRWPFPVSQNLNIVSWDHPSTKGIVIHEIGHALGLYHEQSRSDRDMFVDIHNENIDDDFESQFALSPSLNIGDYDFESIMHYRRCAFSINGLDTIVAKPEFAAFQNIFGQRLELSDSDKAGMATIYGALSPTSAPAATPFPGNYDTPIQFSLVIFDAIDQGNTRYFYTLDGSDPTTSSTEYFKGDVVSISSNTTVKYFALQEQHSPSIIVAIPYTFTNATPVVANPVFTPLSGSYGPGQMVTLMTATPDADIYFAFGGTVPTQSSILYTGPFALTASSFIGAKAFKAGHTPSGVTNVDYEFQEVQLSPPPGFFPNPAAQEYPGEAAHEKRPI